MNITESFNLHNLRNNEHYQFMTDVDNIILKLNTSELGIDNVYPDFKNALTIEEKTMRVESGSSKSMILEDLDTLRDNTWNAIITKVKATLLSPFDDEFQSAVIIKRIIDSYGDPRNLSYNEESAALTNLVNDLLFHTNITHIEKIGLNAWVNELKSQNENFLKTFNERNMEYANRESGDVRATRKIIDPLYETIISKINANVILNAAKPDIVTFINEVNEKIKYYKTTLASRISRKKTTKTSSEKTS